CPSSEADRSILVDAHDIARSIGVQKFVAREPGRASAADDWHVDAAKPESRDCDRWNRGVRRQQETGAKGVSYVGGAVCIRRVIRQIRRRGRNEKPAFG